MVCGKMFGGLLFVKRLMMIDGPKKNKKKRLMGYPSI
jgi:hypothetical protein